MTLPQISFLKSVVLVAFPEIPPDPPFVKGGDQETGQVGFMNPLLEVRALHQRFPVASGGWPWRAEKSWLHAVEDVNFTLQAGESLGLVGESGCGKSTLVSLLARLADPVAGEIRFDGARIDTIPARHFTRSPLRRDIQIVFQDSQDSLNPRFSAYDTIADPLRRLAGLRGAQLRERVRETAERVGLPQALLSRFPHQLSGGQKARVNIGRAVALQPKLLILDEPTSALDVSVQAVILKLLARLRSELGMSYLFVSHDLNVVRLLCDRVLVMYLGRIIESGPAEALFRDPAHPYTRALLSAIPSYHAEQRRVRVRLNGEPRSPIDPDPAVCRFYGRCPQGESRCASSAPPLMAIGPGRHAACHFVTPVREAPVPVPLPEPESAHDTRISRTAAGL